MSNCSTASVMTFIKVANVASAQTLQVSISMLNIKVHERTIRKRLIKYGLLVRQDQSGHVWPLCRVPYLVKTKHSISAQTSHRNWQTCWLRRCNFGFVLQPPDLDTFKSSTVNSSVWKWFYNGVWGCLPDS